MVLWRKKNKAEYCFPHSLSLSPSLPHTLSLYLYPYLSLYKYLYTLYISLSISPSLSIYLHQSDSKNRTGPQFLLHIGGDRGPIETIDLAVCEYISEIFGADI